ncbi:MAG TPA: thioredoxin domain-containing protein [Thermoguttaceae bacterium]|nr:thioredoxin domain-containing protein [Thermoguttaceae bacterium]
MEEAKTRAEPSGPAAATIEYPANRLADESSLYLQMHAHNPVDWYPWGEEALEKARDEGKLIFLSIGYSSCFWCHVMERETFMDAEAAAVLNEHFVAVKVDREERPDLDQIYMTALQIYFQAIGSPQSGGWPLTMVLTPDARPLLGGTYFPPRTTDRVAGLIPLLERVQQLWKEDPQKLEENSRVLATLVRRQLQQQPAAEETPLDARLLDGVLEALSGQYDAEFGGFGYNPANPRLPKFPEPSNLVFLLDRVRRDRQVGETAEDDGGKDHQAETMLVATLEKMAAGGIRDHVGGGFHRYSTDRFWSVPHFEKMLYDNAQLASVYAEAHALTGRAEFRRIVEEILAFVSREMVGPEGGFYSAIDAETQSEEGRYYVWQRDELTDVLDPQEFQLLAGVYGIDGQGNFDGRHVLLLPRPIAQTAAVLDTTETELLRQLLPIREKLLDARNRRERPLTDTKILTAWTGLMIRGYADAGRVLDDPRYVETAAAAADFVLEKLRTPEGRLLRTFGAGKAKLNAYLDDYAFLVDGLIALHRATGQPRWLEEADRLTAIQIESFRDDERGGFFFTSDDHETLLARSKDPTDSVLPSGNAVSAGNLVYLAGALNKPDYLDRAEQTIRAFAPLLKDVPGALPRMAVSLAALLKARG